MQKLSLLSSLMQCFSTAVPRHTGVPQDIVRCAVVNYPIGVPVRSSAWKSNHVVPWPTQDTAPYVTFSLKF